MRSLCEEVDGSIWNCVVSARDEAFADGVEGVRRKNVGEVNLNILLILDCCGDDTKNGSNVGIRMNIKRCRYLSRRRLRRKVIEISTHEVTYHIFLCADSGRSY